MREGREFLELALSFSFEAGFDQLRKLVKGEFFFSVAEVEPRE